MGRLTEYVFTRESKVKIPFLLCEAAASGPRGVKGPSGSLSG